MPLNDENKIDYEKVVCDPKSIDVSLDAEITNTITID